MTLFLHTPFFNTLFLNAVFLNADSWRRAARAALVVFVLWPTLIAAAPRSSTLDAQVDGVASSRVVLRKCVGGDGAIAYQSATCASGSRELWWREEKFTATPPFNREVIDTLNQTRAHEINATGGFVKSAARQRCDAARREAAHRRDREWNRLKFDDLSALDAWVAERCR